ncbi:hypothetical protein Vretifemale_17066, partial [Volvox reticuliferus]
QERVLRHIFGVFLEEVISHMSDCVPPSEVVRHIIHSYGNHDFGGFRSNLLGLLGSCAYEQAIMCSAQRLISRGIFLVVDTHEDADDEVWTDRGRHRQMTTFFTLTLIVRVHGTTCTNPT